jgi:hypothetical protein
VVDRDGEYLYSIEYDCLSDLLSDWRYAEPVSGDAYGWTAWADSK